MSFLKHRHLMCCALAFMLSLFTMARVDSAWRFAFLIVYIALAATAAFFLRQASPMRLQAFLICLSLTISAVVGINTFTLHMERQQQCIGTTRNLTLTVTSVKTSMPYLTEMYVEYAGNGALLTCEYPFEAFIGQKLTGEFFVDDFERDINGYNQKQHMFSLGNYVHLYSRENNLTQGESAKVANVFFHNVQSSATKRFSRLLEKDTASFFSCILLGERDSLPARIKRNFNELGISHMLAISGMHLSVLIGGFYWVLRLLRIPKGARILVTILFLFIFLAITGFPSSLTRAATASIIVMLCFFIKKRPDSATALCLAVSVIYLFDPCAVFDIGLTLSFAAAFGIVVIFPLMSKRLRQKRLPSFIKYIAESIFVSAIALSFTMPFTLYYFGTFTFVSVFTTLLFTPILVCSLYLAVFVMLFGSLSLPGEVFCFLSETLYTFTSRLCSLLSDCMYTVLSAEYPFARILTILFVISLLALLLFSVQRPWAYLIPVLTFTVCLYTSVAIYNACNAHSVSSVMRETNRNDFLAFRIGGETTVLDIGACTASSRRAGLHAARTGIYSTMVDNYMLLNHNNRTPAYLSTLLDDTRIYNLYIPEEFSNTESYKSICQTAKENGTKVHTFTFGERTEMGNIAILTMTPKHIQRSKVPIHGIEIQGAGSTFFYAGAAFIESGGKLPETQSIIFGSYGPLYKEKFSVKTEQNIFTSPTAQLFFEGTATVYTDSTKDILNNS